jgi:hypothetical protein
LKTQHKDLEHPTETDPRSMEPILSSLLRMPLSSGFDSTTPKLNFPHELSTSKSEDASAQQSTRQMSGMNVIMFHYLYVLPKGIQLQTSIFI